MMHYSIYTIALTLYKSCMFVDNPRLSFLVRKRLSCCDSVGHYVPHSFSLGDLSFVPSFSFQLTQRNTELSINRVRKSFDHQYLLANMANCLGVLLIKELGEPLFRRTDNGMCDVSTKSILTFHLTSIHFFIL